MKQQIIVGMVLIVGLFICGAGQPEQALSETPCTLRAAPSGPSQCQILYRTARKGPGMPA